jgi:diacylglycerol kinase (ATP)
MRVLLIVNPRSGRGQAAAAANRLGSILVDHTVTRVEMPRADSGDHAWLLPRLRESDACVVLGGDGTVHALLPALIECGTPMYHLALGTENLLARQFGMHRADFDQAIALAVASLRSPRPGVMDVGRCDAPLTRTPARFALMLSAGPDAGVIHRLHEARSGPITHVSYLRHVRAEFRVPHLPFLDVEVDGSMLCTGLRGMLVIANSRQYALRIDPAPRAIVDDGLLDVAILPARSAWSTFARLAACRLRLGAMAGVKRARGAHVRFRLQTDHTIALQADGEALHLADPIASEAEGSVTVEPAALRLLLPPA